MNGWRNSRVVALIVIAAFLAIQMTIPVNRLVHRTPQRFAWQMYSMTKPFSEFMVTTSDDLIEIDRSDFLAAARAEIDYEELMPPHLCAVVPDAVVVKWEEGTYRC